MASNPGAWGASRGCGRCCLGILLLAASLAGMGCGGEPVVQVSGEITFNGKPVPAGRLWFNPDFSQGNDGPAGSAEIRQSARAVLPSRASSAPSRNTNVYAPPSRILIS